MISVLYPIYELYKNQSRLDAFNISINNLDDRFDDIVIADTGKESSEPFIKTNKKFSYIWEPGKLNVINKSKTINIGFSKLKNELFIILDADILMEPLLYDKLLNLNLSEENPLFCITKHYHYNKSPNISTNCWNYASLLLDIQEKSKKEIKNIEESILDKWAIILNRYPESTEKMYELYGNRLSELVIKELWNRKTTHKEKYEQMKKIFNEKDFNKKMSDLIEFISYESGRTKISMDGLVVHYYKPGRFILTNKKTFNSINGFDESYEGYGNHDYKFMFDYACTYPLETITCFNIFDIHMFHENNRRVTEKEFHNKNEKKVWDFFNKNIPINPSREFPDEPIRYWHFIKKYFKEIEV